jgi:hypothetical protein
MQQFSINIYVSDRVNEFQNLISDIRSIFSEDNINIQPEDVDSIINETYNTMWDEIRCEQNSENRERKRRFEHVKRKRIRNDHLESLKHKADEHIQLFKEYADDKLVDSVDEFKSLKSDIEAVIDESFSTPREP